MDSPTLPFSIRYRKPFWLLICSDTGRTAVYNVHGALMAEHGSDELVAFAAESFVEICRWSEVPGSMRPRQMAGWMTKDAAARYFLFALRSVDTETRAVIATPDA